MNLYSYVITRDYGFAPNPFWGICSLATCKPQIRQRALKGDWIAGFSGANTRCIDFIDWVKEHCGDPGQHGLPHKWNESDKFVRFKGEKDGDNKTKRIKKNKSI